MKKLLVMGIGNILLKDEGVGVYCLQALKKKPWPGNVSFIDGGVFTQDIFCLLAEFQHVLVLDAVRGGKEPGALYRLKKEDLPEKSRGGISLHQVGLADSLKMAELLGSKPGITVLGVEPEMVIWEKGLTQTLKKTFPDFVELAEKEIINILKDMDY